jgi:hypothetical protein
MIIGDILAHSGVSEAELVKLARQSARLELAAVN